ncbi:membrane protein [Mycobacterium phage DyoEdafos]|uniref:Membrane protein n=1 Tax=Mycobacterium phage DyoEdafos TaxID=2599860 RepID=A0A5J6TH69_9CAUD|nr:membrane protein [Mycobacterium phage DyoEdafos]QFG10261.1 membrane protein [Mycobacterium phage DyoEdafos]
MKIFGHKPSEIRKALMGFASALLVLLIALPVAGLPVAVSAAVAGVVSFLVGVSVYLSKPNVAAVIDAADNLPGDYPDDLEAQFAPLVGWLKSLLGRVVGLVKKQ